MRSPAIIVLAAALLVAGCGTQPDTGKPTAAASAAGVPVLGASAGLSGEFNDTDVMFLQMLLPHHRQGIALVKIGAERSTREDLTILAKAIEVTQTEEADRMAGWLRTWKQPATADAAAHAAHGGMPGTSEQEMSRLRAKTGAEFDRDFLNTLIAHQDDAVQLARMETAGGVNPTAKAYAKSVDESRTAEIKQMLAYLEAK